jgi:excisionase family DNA binding protein
MTSISEATEQRHPVQAELLSVAEVSAIFRVSKMTVYRMMRAGEIGHVRVGKSYRIFAESVRDRLTP